MGVHVDGSQVANLDFVRDPKELHTLSICPTPITDLSPRWAFGKLRLNVSYKTKVPPTYLAKLKKEKKGFDFLGGGD
jgi:hypothetical protein